MKDFLFYALVGALIGTALGLFDNERERKKIVQPSGGVVVSTPVPFVAMTPQFDDDGYMLIVDSTPQYDYVSTEPPDSYSNGVRIDETAWAQGKLHLLMSPVPPGWSSDNYLDPGVSAETAAGWCAQYVGPNHKWRYEPPDRCYWETNPGEWQSVPVHAMWLYTPRPGE